MTTSELNGGLHKKILAVAAAVGVIPKNGINKHFKYKYVKDSDIINGLRGLMAQHGVMVTPEILSVIKDANNTVIEMAFHVTDTETGHSVVHRWYGESNDKQDKGISQSVTSAQKYFLKTLFMISTENPVDDPDNNGESQVERGRGTVPRKANKPASPAPSTKWTDNNVRVQGFYEFAQKEKGLAESQVLELLGVTAIKDYTGSDKDASDIIKSYNPFKKQKKQEAS